MLNRKIPLSWLQLTRKKPRLLVALAGIAFADILMFMHLDAIKVPDTLLFDQASRGDYQQAIAQINQGKTVTTELSDRKINLVGLFSVGAFLGADGSLITSDLNFLRLFPQRNVEDVSIGFITLQPGADLQQTRVAFKEVTFIPPTFPALPKYYD